MDILTLLFASIFLIFLPLGQLLRIPIGSGFTLVPLDVVVAITSIVWVLIQMRKKQKPKLLFFPIVFFLLTGVISLLVNLFWLKGIALFISFLYLFRWGSYITCMWIAIDVAKKSKKRLQTLLIVSGGIVMGLGLMQYVFYPSLHPYLYLGWDDHFYRVFSTFLDPNFVGAFLVLYFFFLLSLVLEYWKKIKLCRVFIVILVCTLFAIFLTYSRSAYLMLGIGITLFLWHLGFKKWIGGAVVGIGIIIVLLVVFHRYGEGNNLLRTASIASRLGSMTTAITIFTKEPVLGVGFNSYRYAQRKYGFLQGNLWEVTHAGAGTSNSFLFVLVTTGIVGLSAYLFFLYKIFQQATKTMKKKKIMGILLFVSLFSLCVNAFFENTLFYPSIMLWIFTLVGYITG